MCVGRGLAAKARPRRKEGICHPILITYPTQYTTLLQNGGTLLVRGTFHANNYYYHGGDILVTGKLYGNTWNSEKPRFYEHCNYGGTWVELPEGNYDQASMIAMGIPDNWLSSVRAGKGYQITLYEHPGYTGKQLVLTEDHPCLSSDNFNDLNSALKIERISGNLSTCTPGAGTTNTVGTLTNYGTFSFATPTFPEGTKIYNYGTLNIANFHLPNTSEIHNFSGVTSTIFDIAPTASVYSKPASRIASVNLLIRGNVEGDAFNYSEITTANTTLQSSGSVDGLIKLCATQTFQGTGTIGSAVVRDCSFDIPVLKQRTAHLYRSQQGHKAYELSNHLGNVLTTISDRRIGVAGSNPALIDHYMAVILSSQDYYAFGWEMPGRKYNSGLYRYGGAGGQEKDIELGEGLYTAEYWKMDSRLGRRWNVDPLYNHYPWQSTYTVFDNSPITLVDPLGLGTDEPPKEGASKEFLGLAKNTTITKYYHSGGKTHRGESTQAGWYEKSKYKQIISQYIDFAYNEHSKEIQPYISGTLQGAELQSNKILDAVVGERYNSFTSSNEILALPNQDGKLVMIPTPNTSGIGMGEAFNPIELIVTGGWSLLRPTFVKGTINLLSNGGKSVVAAKTSFKSFNSLDDLGSLFKNKSLTNASDDLIKSGWKKLEGNWGSRTVFEKQIGNQRYYAQWEVNTVHSTINQPVGYWKLTYGKINATSENTIRVSPSPNFKP
jgi:hypothetical protein